MGRFSLKNEDYFPDLTEYFKKFLKKHILLPRKWNERTIATKIVISKLLDNHEKEKKRLNGENTFEK